MAKNASKFDDIGVKLTDSTGKFRKFSDIALDAAGILNNYGNDVEKATKAQELFNRFGITAFAAISNQVAKGIKTTTGEVLKGRSP